MKQSFNYSPLRYPGGKSKLYNLVNDLIRQYGEAVSTYVEPFAGGAGIALGLLLNHKVDRIIINDINIGIYSFWNSVCNDTDNLLRLISETEINIDTFNRQKNIYKNETQVSLELGFASFFLNRTSFSGVLSGGPIGGYNQTGNYLIDARYNRSDLISKIEKIALNKSNIELFNLDIIEFIKQVVNKKNKIFTYFDPPYYVNGKKLYTNYLKKGDHKKIFDKITQIKSPWLLTYDNADDISDIYKEFTQYEFSLSYTVNPKVYRKATELLIASDNDKIDSINEDIRNKINLKRKEMEYVNN